MNVSASLYFALWVSSLSKGFVTANVYTYYYYYYICACNEAWVIYKSRVASDFHHLLFAIYWQKKMWRRNKLEQNIQIQAF